MPTPPKINPHGPLQGKVALVTGASRGIGEAIAVRLAMEGARIAVSARTAEAGESRLPGTLGDTVERIRRAGGEAILVKSDLAQARELEGHRRDIRASREPFGAERGRQHGRGLVRSTQIGRAEPDVEGLTVERGSGVQMAEAGTENPGGAQSRHRQDGA